MSSVDLVNCLCCCCSRKLHAELSQKFLIHMCLSLIGLYTSFLLSQLWGQFYNEVSSNARGPVCITFSALVHYFLLVYFCITVAQSILLYVKLVMVFGARTRAIEEFYHVNAGVISWSKLLCSKSIVIDLCTIEK